MKNLLFICFLGIVSAFSQGIQADLILEKVLEADTYVGQDKFGGEYFIRKNVVYKRHGLAQYQFNDFQLGQIENVDIVNPLQIVLFYKNANTAVILDNRLTEIKRINFNELTEFRNVGHAASAGENNLWIWNLDEQRLEIFNMNRKSFNRKTPPIRQQVRGMASNFNFSWIYTQDRIFMFNIYGVLVREIPLQGIEALEQDNNNLVFFQNEKLYYLPNESEIPLEINVPVLGREQFYLKDEILYIYNNRLVRHYKLKLPKKE